MLNNTLAFFWLPAQELGLVGLGNLTLVWPKSNLAVKKVLRHSKLDLESVCKCSIPMLQILNQFQDDGFLTF